MNVEDAFRDIRTKVALLRYLATTGTTSEESPDQDVLAGIATLCEEIESLTRAVARAVPVEVLGVELRRPRTGRT
jgi:hypothetical protein